MKYWPTLLLLVILAGLAGYLYFVELPSQKREEIQEARNTTLLQFPENTITGLTITTPQGPVEMKSQASGSWMMTAPLQA